jgi:hypothetical protein
MKLYHVALAIISFHVSADDALKIITEKYGSLESDYQNMQVLIEPYNNEYVLKKYSESITKNEVTFTFTSDFEKVDCIYNYYYSHSSHMPIGIAICGLNIIMNNNLLDNYSTYFEKINLNNDDKDILRKNPISYALYNTNDGGVFSINSKNIDSLINDNFYINWSGNESISDFKFTRYYLIFDKKLAFDKVMVENNNIVEFFK